MQIADSGTIVVPTNPDCTEAPMMIEATDATAMALTHFLPRAVRRRRMALAGTMADAPLHA